MSDDPEDAATERPDGSEGAPLAPSHASESPPPSTGEPEVPARAPLDPDAAARPLHTRPSFLLLLVLGGGVGTVLRYLVEEAAPAPPGGWPWATFWINIVGSFVLGALLAALARGGPDEGWRRRVRLGVGTGVCGGLTTYSTFIVEIDTLLRGGWVATGLGYAVVSVAVGIAAALAGVLLLRTWPRRRPGPLVAT